MTTIGSDSTATPETEDRLAILELIGRLALSLDGCAANTQGVHVFANGSGGPIWTVGGRHDYQLKRIADGWRIAGRTFTIQWATGNMNIISLAAGGGDS